MAHRTWQGFTVDTDIEVSEVPHSAPIDEIQVTYYPGLPDGKDVVQIDAMNTNSSEVMECVTMTPTALDALCAAWALLREAQG